MSGIKIKEEYNFVSFEELSKEIEIENYINFRIYKAEGFLFIKGNRNLSERPSLITITFCLSYKEGEKFIKKLKELKFISVREKESRIDSSSLCFSNIKFISDVYYLNLKSRNIKNRPFFVGFKTGYTTLTNFLTPKMFCDNFELLKNNLKNPDNEKIPENILEKLKKYLKDEDYLFFLLRMEL